MMRGQFALCGAGFWSHFQLAAWLELEGIRCRAICDPDRSKAEALAKRFSVSRVYTDAEEMLSNEPVQFVDIVSSPGSHETLVTMAAKRRVPVICQKPMAEDWESCQRMVNACRETNTWFAIHENWRWQSTLRRTKELIDENAIGDVFRCRIDFITGFDVFANQPTLRNCDQFIIADLGCHVLDYARCLFGEAQSIYCRTKRVSAEIQGEDVATMSLWMNEGQTMVDIYIAYALTPLEIECFPQTRMFAEGSHGSLQLLADYRIRITSNKGTREEHVPPPFYPWADQRYSIVHSSLVACNQHQLSCLEQSRPSETDGWSNIRSMQLVFAAYESAARNESVRIVPFR